VKAIVAVDKSRGIGKDNDLLFSILDDMKFFRSTTLNKVVVMGRKTLQSFPNSKPLKNRVNVVISSTVKEIENAIVVPDFKALKKELEKYVDEDVFVIGGASVYNALLPYCEMAMVTKVDADGGATAFIDNLDENEGWELSFSSEPLISNGYKITFNTYVNKQIKKL
jgi:dihydrofolate reductase